MRTTYKQMGRDVEKNEIILSKIENEEILDYDENEIYEMYKDLVKPEFWEEATKKLKIPTQIKI